MGQGSVGANQATATTKKQTRGNLGEIKINMKLRLSPVVPHVKRVEALGEALHVVGADLLQEVDVVLRVEATHVVLRGFVRLENLIGNQVKRYRKAAKGSECVPGRLHSPSFSCRVHSATPGCESRTNGEASSGGQYLVEAHTLFINI